MRDCSTQLCNKSGHTGIAQSLAISDRFTCPERVISTSVVLLYVVNKTSEWKQQNKTKKWGGCGGKQ